MPGTVYGVAGPESYSGPTQVTQKVYVVYLNLYNFGRGPAVIPVVQFMLYDFKLPKFMHLGLDMASLDKEAHQITSKTYSNTASDEISEQNLADEFIERTRKVEYLYGHGEGRRFLFGFAFENGKHFFFASDEAALPTKLPFTDKTQYVVFATRARNTNKLIGFNIEFKMPAWNQAKFDYKEWPIVQMGGKDSSNATSKNTPTESPSQSPVSSQAFSSSAPSQERTQAPP